LTRNMRDRHLPTERADGEDSRPDAGDLAAECARRWLDPTAGEAELRGLLVPLPAEGLEAYEVSALVNSPRNDSAECTRPVE
jgi:hypothetical protein